MKGYITNGVCYIFPQEAAQIPEVEADVFYVQQEDYAAWVAANESLADKIVKYNYSLLAVRPKPFAGHTNDDLEPAQKTDPELSWSEPGWTVTIGADDNIYPELRNPYNVSPLAFSSSDESAATINENGEITLVAAGETIISVIFAGDDTYESENASYLLTVNAAQAQTYSFTINISDEESPINVGSYEEGAEVTYTFDRYFTTDQSQMWNENMTPSDLEYTFDPGAEAWVDDSDPENPVDYPEEPASISFTMPASDVTFELIYVNLYTVNVNDEYRASEAEGAEVTIILDGPVDSILPNDLEYTYDSGTGYCSFTMPAEEVYIYTTTPEPDPENPE